MTSHSIGTDGTSSAAPRRRSHATVVAFADQAVSSVTNLSVGLFAAAVLSARSFGALSLAILCYTLLLGLANAVTSEPLVTRYSARPRHERELAAHGGLVLAFVVALFGTGTAGLVALFIDGEVAEVIAVLGLVLPGLVLHDYVRFCNFAAGRSAGALRADMAWCLGVALCAGYIIAFDPELSAAQILGLWGFCALLAVPFGAHGLGLRVRPVRLRQWVRDEFCYGSSLALDFFLMTGASYLAFFVAGAVSGLAAVASLRAALVVFGPVSLVIAGLKLIVLPRGAMLAHMPAALQAYALRIAAVVTGFAVAWGIVTIVLPDAFGSTILGETWIGVSPLLPIMTVVLAGRALAIAPFFGLRVLTDGRRILRARRIDAPVTVLLGATGAALGAARGAAVGMAAANLIAAAGWWWQFRSSLRAAGTRGPESTGVDRLPAM